MQHLYSPLPKQAYLAALKRKFDNPFCFFGEERMTGFVVGPFFSVAHHMPWEWNRRITSECNRAYGFVSVGDDQTEVRYICSRGLLSPFWLVFFTLFSEMLLQWGNLGYGVSWICSMILSLVICGFTAINVGLTENGRTGLWEVHNFLQNPEEY